VPQNAALTDAVAGDRELVHVGEKLYLVVALSPAFLRINSAKGLWLSESRFASLGMTAWVGIFVARCWGGVG